MFLSPNHAIHARKKTTPFTRGTPTADRHFITLSDSISVLSPAIERIIDEFGNTSTCTSLSVHHHCTNSFFVQSFVAITLRRDACCSPAFSAATCARVPFIFVSCVLLAASVFDLRERDSVFDAQFLEPTYECCCVLFSSCFFSRSFTSSRSSTFYTRQCMWLRVCVFVCVASQLVNKYTLYLPSSSSSSTAQQSAHLCLRVFVCIDANCEVNIVSRK